MNEPRPPQGERLWNERFIQLIVIEVTFQMGAYLTNPVVSGFAVSLGASVAVGGVLAGLVALMALVARPITGWLADKVDKKTFLLVSAVLFGAACFGCAFSSTVAPVAAWRVVQGFAFAFKSAVLISLVSLSVPQRFIGRAVGWASLAQTASMALGPLLGSVLIGRWGYATSFLVAGVLLAVGLVVICAFKEPHGAAANAQATADAPASVRPASRLGWISKFVYLPNLRVALIVCLSIIPHGVAVTLLLTVGEMRGIEGVSLYFAVYALVALVSKPTAGRLTDQRGTRFVLVPSLLIELAATVALALMGSALAVVLAGALMGAGQGSALSALQAESVRGVAPHELGRASNTFYIGTDIGMGVGPMAAGVVLQQFGVAVMFLACSALVALAMVVLLAGGTRREGEGVS
ncbi:MAG: MFS transporter [Eggerthellaceae bacterium]|nr:MFS transporter [Eggerthellaceae bacterium]